MAYIGLRLRWIACIRRHPPERRPCIWPLHSYVSGGLHVLGAIHLRGDILAARARRTQLAGRRPQVELAGRRTQLITSQVDCMY